MGIDYTKRPKPADEPPATGKVILTKAAPTVSLTKQGSAGGLMRVNLNWNARPPASGPEIEVRLDESRDGARICGIALLEGTGSDLSVRREVNYVNGGQRALDEAYGWGMQWAAGRK